MPRGRCSTRSSEPATPMSRVLLATTPVWGRALTASFRGGDYGFGSGIGNCNGDSGGSGTS